VKAPSFAEVLQPSSSLAQISEQVSSLVEISEPVSVAVIAVPLLVAVAPVLVSLEILDPVSLLVS
jgi:hypothetical protein